MGILPDQKMEEEADEHRGQLGQQQSMSEMTFVMTSVSTKGTIQFTKALILIKRVNNFVVSVVNLQGPVSFQIKLDSKCGPLT